MTTEPMMPTTMAMSSMLTFRRRKGKNCYDEDLNLDESDSYYFRSKQSCFWNNSNNNYYWSKHDCCGNNIISFKMMLTLEWSGSREGNSHLNDKLLRCMFLHGSNNNKPNQWKRIRKKMQIHFLCPWLYQTLIQLLWLTTTKDPNQCASCEIDRWRRRRMLRNTQKGFDTINLKPTRMHAQLNYRYSCTVDPSWTQDWIMARKTVETRRTIEQPTTR